MRRRVTMVLTLVLPLAAYSWSASAQPKATTPASSAQSHAVLAGSSAPAAAASASPALGGSRAGSTLGSAPSEASTMSTPASGSESTATVGLAAPGSAGVSGGGAAMNGATYEVRLRDLEQRVDELKDQIRRSHTRLALLSDTILGGGGAGSRSEVEFKNEMSSAFQLTRALFVIDGQVQYNRQDQTGALAEQKEIPIYSGSLPPGDHTIQIALTFQGNGYGVFSYLRGYKFEVKSSHAFTSVDGKTLAVSAIAYEKGGVTTPLEQRPAIEWQEKVRAIGASGTAAPPGAAAHRAPPPPAGGASVSGTLSIGGGGK